MKAILKHIHSPDVFNLPGFIPEKKNNFSMLLQLIVGPLNGEGEENFDIILCTPQWLIENYQEYDIIVGRHHLIVFEYNFPRIYNKLKDIVETIDGENWEDIALKVGRIGKWEFEDYQE